MKETANYKLKKPEKNEYINIDDLNSNMDTLDRTVKSVENQSIAISRRLSNVTWVTLTASGWTGNQVPYIQTVVVDEVTEDDNPLLVSGLADGASKEEHDAYDKAFGIIASGTGISNDGSITFKVYKKPITDIVVGLMGIGAVVSSAYGASVTNMVYSSAAPQTGENWARIISGRLEVDPQDETPDTTYLAKILEAKYGRRKSIFVSKCRYKSKSSMGKMVSTNNGGCR